MDECLVLAWLREATKRVVDMDDSMGDWLVWLCLRGGFVNIISDDGGCQIISPGAPT